MSASVAEVVAGMAEQVAATATAASLLSDQDAATIVAALGKSSQDSIKPLMALAGLEYGVVEPTDTRFCPGYFRLPGSTHRYRDWKKEGHGTVDMHKAVMTSCDVYFYNLAVTLGIQRMHDSMTRMGFGELTGIDVDGERPGIMPSPARHHTTGYAP